MLFQSRQGKPEKEKLLKITTVKLDIWYKYLFITDLEKCLIGKLINQMNKPVNLFFPPPTRSKSLCSRVDHWTPQRQSHCHKNQRKFPLLCPWYDLKGTYLNRIELDLNIKSCVKCPYRWLYRHFQSCQCDFNWAAFVIHCLCFNNVQFILCTSP